MVTDDMYISWLMVAEAVCKSKAVEESGVAEEQVTNWKNCNATLNFYFHASG